MLRAETHHLEGLFKIEFKGPDRFLYVVGRLRDPRERNDGVGLNYLGLEDLVILKDIALAEGEAALSLKGGEICGGDVEAVDLPIGLGEYVFQQVRTDETVYSGDE